MAGVTEPSIRIEYDQSSNLVAITTEKELANSYWFLQIARLLADTSDSTEHDVRGKISAPWWCFLRLRSPIRDYLKAYHVKTTISELAKTHILASNAREKEFKAQTQISLSSDDLYATLEAFGWDLDVRRLKDYQLKNVISMSRYHAAATFSVPGAGKTTEALAFFALKADISTKLLVVSPKNAFLSWDEQLDICVVDKSQKFVRLQGGIKNIKLSLKSYPKYMIMTYQQLPNVIDEIAAYLSSNKVMMFLDESHRIKSGRGKPTADSVLRIAHLPIGKLVMSGTPMPQGEKDLVSQFEFLYPELTTYPETVVKDFQPIFVRTTKSDLNLPPPIRRRVDIRLGPAQKRLHDFMKSEVFRLADTSLKTNDRRAFRALGKSVMRMIEVVSNPSLLLDDITFIDQDLLREVLADEAAPKIVLACDKARALAKEGQKCIIWTTFRKNVETIANRLADLNAVFIHGGVDTGEEDEDNTRENRIKSFKNDDSCFVLVANPAAAAESISLHMVCHHAIYVDRTFNAAHYLQSEDRIHRLGLPPETETYIDILCCPDTIDECIQQRLELKVERMAMSLNDSSLSIETSAYDIGVKPDVDIEDSFEDDDLMHLVQWLKETK